MSAIKNVVEEVKPELLELLSDQNRKCDTWRLICKNMFGTTFLTLTLYISLLLNSILVILLFSFIFMDLESTSQFRNVSAEELYEVINMIIFISLPIAAIIRGRIRYINAQRAKEVQEKAVRDKASFEIKIFVTNYINTATLKIEAELLDDKSCFGMELSNGGYAMVIIYKGKYAALSTCNCDAPIIFKTADTLASTAKSFGFNTVLFGDPINLFGTQ